MVRVSDIFATHAQSLSFEIFPPKGDLTLESAHAVAAELAQLEPDFISVTYSAGGSGNSQATARVAAMIQTEFGVPAVAHLTCAEATEASLAEAVRDLHNKGIETVLALRGDKVPGSKADSETGENAEKGIEADVRPFCFAKDLIPRLVEAGFCVGAAAYPEGHIACIDDQANVEYLKQKQDAGASFFVTQLFFDNAFFYRFREAAAVAGVTVPITCGIMPFLSKTQIQRMVFMCGASLPSPIIKLLAKYEDAPDDLRRAGIEYANAQLVDLAAHGVRGLHVYTMNQPDIARASVKALRAAAR